MKTYLPYISITLTFLGFLTILLFSTPIGSLILTFSLLFPAILFYQDTFWIEKPASENSQFFQKDLYNGYWYINGKLNMKI